MKKINFLIACIIALLVLNAATLFIIFRMHLNSAPDRDHGGEKGPAEFIIRKLKLDDAQQQQFAILRDEHRHSMDRSHEEDMRLHHIYFGLIKTAQPDKAIVDSIAGLIGNQRREVALATFDHFQKLRAICRDDQKVFFDDAIDEIAESIMHQGPPPGSRREHP
jgi:protein CpxP